MKRLRKLADDKTVTYHFKSPIYISHVGEVNDYGKYPINQASHEEIMALEKAVKEEMTELGQKGLAQYLDEPLKSIIDSIIVTVTESGADTIVKAKRELSDQEIEMLKDEIEGQFSDGWGEGFEQREIDEYTEEYEEEIEVEDPDTGDIDVEVETNTEKVSVYAHFWNDNNFNITVEKE